MNVYVRSIAALAADALYVAGEVLCATVLDPIDATAGALARIARGEA